jgi:glucose-6-phosphate 1-dehydrogenase
MVTHFQSMLTRLGFNALPAYYSKVVYHKISGTSCRSTREDAEADAAWRAISTLNHLFEDQLQNTPFCYYPCHTPGTE